LIFFKTNLYYKKESKFIEGEWEAKSLYYKKESKFIEGEWEAKSAVRL